MSTTVFAAFIPDSQLKLLLEGAHHQGMVEMLTYIVVVGLVGVFLYLVFASHNPKA